MTRQSSPSRSPLPSNPISSASSITHVDQEYTPTFNLLDAFTPKKASLESEAYRIGNQVTPALVTVDDLRASLRLLGAFHQLREEVRCFQQHPQKDSTLESPTSTIDAWETYLARAVYRFELWVKKVVNDVRPEGVGFSLIEIPPLDVVLVWHTYLLNPRVYYEDCVRIYKGLLSRGSFPLHKIAGTIDPSTFTPYAPAFARANHFSTRTGHPFDLAFECLPSDTVILKCPSCSTKMQVPWITADYQGFAQYDFYTVCDKCSKGVDRPTLQIAKFKRDMELIYRYPESYTVAGMLLDPKTGVPATLSKLYKTKTISPRPSRIDFQQQTISAEPKTPISHATSTPPSPITDRPAFKDFNQNLLGAWIPDDKYTSPSSKRPKCKMDGRSVEEMIKMGFTGHVAPYYDNTPEDVPVGLKRILSYYRAPGCFSVDLVKAIQRQEKFTSRMVELGWILTTGRYQYLVDQELNRSVNQYHAFLDIMAVNPKAFLVPTLSIDLAWHTHQLLCDSYRRDTLALLGTIVDHDDSVEEEHIASSFDKTAELWKDRYGVPYSACECSPKKQKQDKRRNDKPKGLRRVLTIFGLNTAKKQESKRTQRRDLYLTRSATLHDYDNDENNFSRKDSRKSYYADFACRPDLVPPPDSGADETHPSEHPSVRVVNHSKIDAMRKVRELKWVERTLAKMNLGLVNGSNGDTATGKDVWDREHVHHHKAAFMEKSENALDWSKVVGGEVGPFVTGVGEAGACRAGNFKPRDAPKKPARPKIQRMPSSGARVFQGAVAGCGGSVAGCVAGAY